MKVEDISARSKQDVFAFLLSNPSDEENIKDGEEVELKNTRNETET